MIEWNPGAAVVRNLVAYHRLPKAGGVWLKICQRLLLYRHRFWSVVSGSDVDLRAKIAPSVRLPHPNGVVIHSDSVVGEGCMIMQQVTIGQLAQPGAPVIGCNVYIGAGAKVLGPVHIGDGAAIGANAVVLTDVPAGHTAVGIPAVCRPSKSRNQA